jgi:hypothetical protein
MDPGHAEEHVMIIELDGTFDKPAAQRLALALEEAGDRDVRVDLSRVKDFHDFGVADLGRALAGRRRVSVRGLRTHQVRLLRYLGVEAYGEPPAA